MTPESWIVREIESLSSDHLFPTYISKYKKWFIVKNAPRRFSGITEYDPVRGRHYIVEMILEDGRHRPLSLNARTVKALRYLFYDRSRFRNMDQALAEVDRNQEQRERRASGESHLRQSDFLKKHKKLLNTKTFT